MDLKIKNVKRQLVWGSGAFEVLCSDTGMSLKEIDIAILSNDRNVLNRLLFSALKNGAEFSDQLIDFNYKFFLKWLDDQPEKLGIDIENDFLKSKYKGKTMQDRLDEVLAVFKDKKGE